MKNSNGNKLGQFLKFLGIIWSILVFILVLTFYSGGEWEIWQKIKKTVSDNDLSSISEMKYKLNLLEKRINGIKLIAKDAGTQDYGCGQARKADSNTLKVMSGLRDGTGCQIGNLNYYKELILIVPE